MKILEFLNSHLDDWEEILTVEPYCIKVKRDNGYILLSYNQLSSDFTNPIVRQCRGSIFKIENGKFKCVCMPFYKFANYGESYADTINWLAAVVSEKIDGSLIKVWWDGTWHVSTNGTIDAYKATIDNYPDFTFGKLFDYALDLSPKSFFEVLDKDYTYMFELVSPYSRVTVPYNDTELYFLSSRNMVTFKESLAPPIHYCVSIPKFFNLNTLNQCLDYVNTLNKDHEGIVVCDNQYHRVKIKSPEYLIAARAANNGVMGLSTALDLIRRNAVDDFKAYCDLHNQYLDYVINCVNRLVARANAEWKDASTLLQGEFTPATAIQIRNNYEFFDYIFKKYKEPSLNVFEYLFFRILNSALCRMVHSEMCQIEKEKRETYVV